MSICVMSYAQTRVRNSLTTERDTLIEQSMTRLFYRRIADTCLVRKGMAGCATMRCTILPYLASVERLPDSGEAIPSSEFNRYGI